MIHRIFQIEKIEDLIENGQIEELITVAKSELELIPQYASWKPWETEADGSTDEVVMNITEDMYHDPYLKALLAKDQVFKGILANEAARRAAEAAEEAKSV